MWDKICRKVFPTPLLLVPTGGHDMNRKKSIQIGLLVLLGASVLGAQWQIYDCSLLPAEADTIWHEQGDNEDNITNMLSVVDDPDISGNKLIQVLDPDGPPKEMWAVNWHADPEVGATLVFRAKALDAGVYDRDLDLYLYDSVVRERFVSNGGTQIKLNKANQSSPLDTGIWHIFRITIIADLLEVFVDEDPLSYLMAQGEILEPPAEDLFRFGDLGSSTMGSLYDWFIWDVSGAYPPDAGSPIPQELLDTGSISTKIMAADDQPADFCLAQNYPNPFNPVTRINFSIPEAAHTTLTILNALGQRISVLIDENLLPGQYSPTWQANQYPAGIYYYQLKSGSRTDLKKMVLLK